jgi:hypothetical protein
LQHRAKWVKPVVRALVQLAKEHINDLVSLEACLAFSAIVGFGIQDGLHQTLSCGSVLPTASAARSTGLIALISAASSSAV